jgi:CRP-like cAMP-binding protein
MDFKQVLFERGIPIEHVYFPVTSVFSILSFMYNGTAVEVATVGNEGFAGIDVLVGGAVATDTTICQVAGDSFRMRASTFKEAVTDDTPLRRIAQRYLQSYLSQVSQSVACNRLHTIEERFARWVLMTHDRVGGDAFRLTHEFLADMLGVHRPSVSLVAGSFQQAGLIKYSRGNLTILDRAGLEEVSCECYAKVKSQFQRLLGA